MELTIPIEDPSRRAVLFGTSDRNLRLIKSAFDVRVTARNGAIHISGATKAVEQAARAIEQLQRMLRADAPLSDEDVDAVVVSIRSATETGTGTSRELIDVFLPSAVIAPKGDGQRQYVQAIRQCDLTFSVGPAGTGKTYLAVAVATSLLRRQRIKRIVLVRPAVEAGEKLGYLPGDLQAKVNPYLRPLFDAMHDMMSFDQLKRFMQNDVIEVVPLAFMRGRTLNHAAIILDEAQNATPSQMLMFLTRLGHHSKMIVTGDDSQSDLASGERSGLTDAIERLHDVDGVAIVRLTRRDIVRHPLVQEVVARYTDSPDEVQ